MLMPTQREILGILVELYEQKKDLVRGEEIAEALNRSSGTIRNQMQTLRALNYAEGVPGPKGGYVPEIKAYEALGMSPIENPVIVNISKDDERLEGIYAHKIIFKDINDPDSCTSIISVLGDTRKIDDGDNITIGPTPVNHIIVKGRVVGRDDTKRELLINTHSISSIPKGKVSSIASKRLISLTPSMNLQECSKLFIENHINGAPIIYDGRLMGILTESEIVKAVSEGKKMMKANDIGIKKVHTIDANTQLISCINKMQKYDVGRLIVTLDNDPVGIITRTDILMRMIQ